MIGAPKVTERPIKAAPPDEAANAAWKEIMSIAEAHALILQAYAGTATLATPSTQREFGLREKVLKMHGMSEGAP